jgi:RNA polymerase sigma-70 factor (ECF subfamily)
MEDSSPGRDEYSIVDRIREGDRCVFEKVFRTHCENLCRFALNFVDHLRVAEDLVQDVFLDLWRKRGDLEVEQSLKAYLYGMVRHRALTYLRRNEARDKWMQKGGLQEVPSRTLADRSGIGLEEKEQKQRARRAIEALSERQYQIFVLSRDHDLTYSEIAVALDISIKTVETHMGRALQSLREEREASTGEGWE